MSVVNGGEGKIASATSAKRRWRRMIPSRMEALTVLASGVLFAIAFPPFNLFFPVFVCLVPLAVFAARNADCTSATNHVAGTAGSVTRTGIWFGFFAYGANLYWIAVALLLYTKLAILGYIGSLVWLAPFIGASITALFYARRRTRWPLAVLLPITWVTLEFVLNYLSDLSFPWLPLGLAVTHTPVLAQLAELSGVRGVSFWIAMVNGLIADAWLLRDQKPAMIKRVAAIAAVFALVLGYGTWRMNSITLKPLAKVSVIQPNIPERAKLTIENPTEHVGLFAHLTRELLRDSAPDLVVWPEAALDRFLWQYPDWADSLQSAVAMRPTPLLTGMLDSYMPDSATFLYYNAAVMTNPYGWIQSRAYRKEFLVPIVERVPFLNPEWFKRLDYFGGYGRGIENKPFPLHFGTVGVMICYESIYPQLSRSYAQQGVALIANITNDAWFQRSNAPYQHFSHMVLRSIETRLPSIRAANTGISGYIDPLGRIRAETPIFVQATETYNVEAAVMGQTIYTRFGDWIGLLCLAGTVALLIAAYVARRR